MTDAKADAQRLKATRRLLNALTVAIYVLAATQAFRSVLPDPLLPDVAAQLPRLTASLTIR